LNAYLLDAARSPIGRYGGSLRPLRATEFGAQVAKGLLDRAGVEPTRVERVIAGMVLQDMTESNPARIVAQRIGLRDAVPAFTVNMQCCSGMVALILAAQQIALGEVDLILVLGLDSMSRAPHMLADARWGAGRAHVELTDTLVECTLAGSKMWGDPWDMIDVAEHHAAVDGVSRREMDEYTLVSHARALDAGEAGRLQGEIVAIDVPQARGGVRTFAADEHPRPDGSLAALSELPPVRAGGTITAGNAAGINDGAAAALVCSERLRSELAAAALARVRLPGTAMVGCDPHLMGYSAVHALDAAVAAAGTRVDELDLIECNEGFAVQLVACQRLGKWPEDRLNVDGGSLGFGHPVGMSGLRIALHLAHALGQRDLRRGAATVPAGSGLGAALVLERS
jgi:acetyl-CoA C-acetyltransferase